MYFIETLIVSVTVFLCVLAHYEYKAKIEMAKLGLDDDGKKLGEGDA